MNGNFKPIPNSGKAWKSLNNSSAKRQGGSGCIFILIQIDGRNTMGRKQHGVAGWLLCDGDNLCNVHPFMGPSTDRGLTKQGLLKLFIAYNE